MEWLLVTALTAVKMTKMFQVTVGQKMIYQNDFNLINNGEKGQIPLTGKKKEQRY